MPSQDLKGNADVVTSLAPVGNRTASASGDEVDLSGFESAMVAFVVGAITDGAHAPSVEESDDNVGWTAVPADRLQGTLSNLASNTNQRVGVLGRMRYVRPVVTVSGAPVTGGQYAAVVVRGDPHKAPVA
jgi:hypothetical protein